MVYPDMFILLSEQQKHDRLIFLYPKVPTHNGLLPIRKPINCSTCNDDRDSSEMTIMLHP